MAQEEPTKTSARASPPTARDDLEWPSGGLQPGTSTNSNRLSTHSLSQCAPAAL
jgi:hypothetical protein